MTVTCHKPRAGNGFWYFTRSIAAGDGDRSMSTPLTPDYAETAQDPGAWLR